MAKKEYGIRLNKQHPAAAETPRGHVWVDESEDGYTVLRKAKRWPNKAAANRAHMEAADEVVCLTPNVELTGAGTASVLNAKLGAEQ